MAAPEHEPRGMRSVLSFETLITPRIIAWLYALLLLSAVVAGGAAMLSVGATFPGFATGLVIVVAGAVVARVVCELLLVLFQINEHMQAVAKRL